MSSRSGKRRGRPPKTAVSERSSLSSRFQYNLKKPKYLQNSDSQFSTPSASRASSPQNSDDGLASRRTSGRSSARRPRAPPASASHSKRGGHSAPANQGRRAYESEYHYGSDFGDSSDDQEQDDDPFLASPSESESMDPVEDDNDSDFSMSSYSNQSNARKGASQTARQPTPEPVWLQDIEVPPLDLPRSSDDLMAPQHLIFRITSLYEVLRRFRNIIRLSPFRLEDFCAALVCEEQSNLLSEIHMMLLKTIIREEDTQATHFGPLDQKDSVNITLYLMDSFTWPEIMRCYVESDPQFDEDVLRILTECEYPFCPIEDRLHVLQFLIDQVLITTPVRDMLLQEGPIQYDDHCRICHRLGDLLCCETCPAVYHLECVEPPMTEIPTEDWQCSICQEHKVSGVNDCYSEQEKHSMLCRQDHLGYDRHGRKYWFLCRRLFVENLEGTEFWYYSTVSQYKALLSRLDPDSLEQGLCAELQERQEEILRQMELTESLTNQHKGGKKSYFEVISERGDDSAAADDEQSGGTQSEDGRGDGETGRMTRNRLQQISTGTLYFKLGMENAFKTYENQFATNINALNKPQRNEERDKKRHLSHKFSLTEASEFKWNGGSSTSIQNIILALRGTMTQLEQTIPAPYLHPNWAGLKKVWAHMTSVAECAQDFTRLLIVLQACMKNCMYANVWYEQLGHTRLYRITSNEREEKKKQEKREKRDYSDEEERHRWAYNFVKYTLGMRHQCWKQKGEEYRLHGQWSWMWLSANRREAAKRKEVRPQFHITPHRIMTKIRAGDKVQVIGVSPVTHERMIESPCVAEDFEGVQEVIYGDVDKCFDYIDVCAALSSSSRRLYPKVAKRSKLDVLLAKRTALFEQEQKEMTPGEGAGDVEEALPKSTITLPNIPCTEADLLRMVGEKLKAKTANGKAVSADSYNSIMKEVVPVRTLFHQLNKMTKNQRCYSVDCQPGPQMVLTKVSNCYSPMCMQRDRVRQELLAIVRRGHALGVSSKDMLNVRNTSVDQTTASSEVDEKGILESAESGDANEEKIITDVWDVKAMVEEVKRSLANAVDYDEDEFNECLTKKAFEVEMEEKALVDEKIKIERDAAAAAEAEKMKNKPVVKMEVDETAIKQEPQEGEEEKPATETPGKRTLRGRPPKPKNLRLREERVAAAAAAIAENGGDPSSILKNGLPPEERTHKWSVLKPKRRFTNKGPKGQKIVKPEVKLEPEIGPNGKERVFSVKCTKGRITLRKQLKPKPPVTGVALARGTKGRLTNKLPIVGNFMAKTGRRSILVLPKHELLHVARLGGRVVPQGYNPNAKTNINVWPYPSPRPLFKTCWVYRMFHANSLNALCLGLRVMWTCLRWDDMQTKPPTLDCKHQVMTENEIINTELLKHRHVGRHMERTQYLRRKVIIPLELPKAVREVTSIRLGLRKRKRADSPQHTEPQVTEEWIDEDKLELWEIRQYGERQERSNVLPVTRTSTGKLPLPRQFEVVNSSAKTVTLTGKSSEEIKEKMEQQLRLQRAALNQKRALENKGLPGTSTPKQIVKTRQIQMRQPDGTIKIVTQQFLSPVATPVVKPAENKVTIIKLPDGKIKVNGLQPGQQLIQLPDGKFQVTPVKTVVARPTATTQGQLVLKPNLTSTPGTKTLVQKIVTPGTPNILQKTTQAKGQTVVTTPGQPRVMTATSLQQLLAQNPGQKIVINQGTPNQRILVAPPAQGQPQQQILVQQPGGQVVQQILLNTGQRIIAGATTGLPAGSPVKAVVQGTQAVQYQIQAQPQATTATQGNATGQTQEMNGSVAQQLLQGKLRMITHNGQQVLIKPLANNQAVIVAHVKPQENGPAQIVMTPQGLALTGGGGGNAATVAQGTSETENAAAEEEAAGSSAPAPTTTTKTIVAQITHTAQGPKIMLSGIGQNELSAQQIVELQQQVKELVFKNHDPSKGDPPPQRLTLTVQTQSQPPPLAVTQSSDQSGGGGYQTGDGGGGGGDESAAADSEGSAAGSINAATKQSIVQKVLSRTGKSSIVVNSAEPGQIIKVAGQSIVGGSNNNAIGQTTTTASGGNGGASSDGDENGFKITPDYIQETIKNCLRQQNLNPEIEEKLLNLQRYQEQQLKDGADAVFTYQPISTVHSSSSLSSRKRPVRRHIDDSDDDLDEELDDGAIQEDDDDEDWLANKRRRKPYVPKTDRSKVNRNSSPFVRPPQQQDPPRVIHNNVVQKPAATATPTIIKPQPTQTLVTLKPKQVPQTPPATNVTTPKVMKVVHQNPVANKSMDLSERLATQSEKLRDSMLKKRETLEEELKQEIRQELDSTLEEIQGGSPGVKGGSGNQENEGVNNSKFSGSATRKRTSSRRELNDSAEESPTKTPPVKLHNAAARNANVSAGKKSQRSQVTGSANASSSKKKEKLYCVCQTPYDDSKFYVGCDMCNNWFHGKCVGISESECEKMDEFVCDGCKHAKEAQELYCLCRKPYDESQFYICCDKCQDWFHGRCVGVLQTEADNIDEYICPNCKKSDAVSAANAKPLSPLEYEQLKRLMKQITTHKSAWPFMEPVDPKEAPDYYTLIAEPMDLSQVENRIDAKGYKTLSDFIGDMTKIFDNCRYYNPKESQFYKLAETLEAFFLQRIKQFRDTLAGGGV